MSRNIPDNLPAVIAQVKERSLHMTDERWARVNPRLSMVAHVLVNRLENDCVLSRLSDAADADDLKALLFVDCYLSLTENPLHRQHMQELLAAGVPLPDIATYVALSFAQELIWPDGAPDDTSVLKSEMFYPIPAAAAQLGLLPEELYADILADRVQAQLVVSWAEVERLLAKRE